uniref:Uncharacterized protein n=1 Tax=Rhizophora mucronata TaxID=61149 RepID=A0A2P2N4B7_RHIMU
MKFWEHSLKKHVNSYVNLPENLHHHSRYLICRTTN